MVVTRIIVGIFVLLIVVPLVTGACPDGMCKNLDGDDMTTLLQSKVSSDTPSKDEHRFKRAKVQFHRGLVADLERDELFKMTWAPESLPGVAPLMAHVARENCNSFEGNGFDCYLESSEHALVQKWIPANATVMEFGARFGTTTCVIAKQLENSGRLVAVEPDQVVWGSLEKNVKTNNCYARVLRGAVSGSPVHMLSSGYGGRSEKNLHGGDMVTVPVFTFDDVEKASGLKVDTLLIDCEGCAQDIMDQIGPKIQSQIKLIVIESDMPDTGSDCQSHCMNYQKFFDFLGKEGFAQVDNFNDCDRTRNPAPKGTWCGPWINHHAFRRR